MSVKVREQRGKLYLDIYHNGTRKWESLHLELTDDKRQNKELMRLAEICRSKREAQLLSGEWNIKSDGAGKIPLVSYLTEFSKRYENKKPASTLVNHLKGYANGATIQIGQVTPKWVDGFQSYLLDREKVNGGKLSESSVAFYMHILCAALHKAALEGTISSDPAANVSVVKRLDPEMVFLNAKELQALAATVPETPFGREIRRAFLFSCFTGLRISDLETITWKMIEREPPQIIKRQKKTKTPAYIPLSKSAQAIIFDGAEHKPEEKLFSFSCTRERSYKVMKEWAADAGITKDIGWHTARRTFATLTLEHGADAITVARLLGHTGLGQVMRYAKATDAMKRRAIEALPDLNIAEV